VDDILALGQGRQLVSGRFDESMLATSAQPKTKRTKRQHHLHDDARHVDTSDVSVE
jgi:hypothetical protein